MKSFPLFLLFLSSILGVQGQVVRIQPDNPEAFHSLKIKSIKSFSDSLSTLRYSNAVITELHKKSFLAAAVDKNVWQNDTLTVHLHIGRQYSFGYISEGNVSREYLKESGFKEKYFKSKKLRFQELAQVEQKMIDNAQNAGYPFASVKLDSIHFNNAQLFGVLNFQKGPKILFDSLQIDPKLGISKKFMIHLLNIFPDELFDQSLVDRAEEILKTLPYVKLDGPVQTYFQSGYAYVRLPLMKRRSNVFNGIIGLLPNASAKRSTLITGEVTLRLNNLFNAGKAFSGDWQRLKEQSQLLKLAYYHPDILHTNVDLGGKLFLYKEDSTFLNIDNQLTFGFLMANAGEFQLKIGNRSSRLLSTSSTSLQDSLKGFSQSVYGLKYTLSKVDDPYFPKKGTRLILDMDFGKKQLLVEKTDALRWVGNASFEGYLQLGKQTILASKSRAGIVSEQDQTLNSLMRIGGLNTLRGFNENDFYISEYMLQNVEFRLFTDPQSYLFAFYDQGFLHNYLNESNFELYPYGFGAGVSFSTTNGVFNLVWSLGGSSSQPVQLSLSKIHFGLVSKF